MTPGLKWSATVVAFGVVASGGMGCSLAFVDQAPPDHVQLRHFNCTTSRRAPVIDVVGAVGSLALVAASVQQRDIGMAMISGMAAVGWGFGGGIGFFMVADCRDAKEGLTNRISAARAAGGWAVPQFTPPTPPVHRVHPAAPPSDNNPK